MDGSKVKFSVIVQATRHHRENGVYSCTRYVEEVFSVEEFNEAVKAGHFAPGMELVFVMCEVGTLDEAVAFLSKRENPRMITVKWYQTPDQRKTASSGKDEGDDVFHAHTFKQLADYLAGYTTLGKRDLVFFDEKGTRYDSPVDAIVHLSVAGTD